MSSKLFIHPAPGLYAIDIKRHPSDLGVSLVLPASCELTARACALKLYPEYKQYATRFSVYPIRYAEIDWQSGRCIVINQRREAQIPAELPKSLSGRAISTEREEESITRIWERLYIGGFDDAEALSEANPNNIGTVISTCDYPTIAQRDGLNYLHFPIANNEAVSLSQFRAIIDAIGQSIRWSTVLLHCAHADSRAPSLAAGYMHAVGYRQFDVALAEIRRLRPHVRPSEKLLESIRRYLQ